jgi:hypothetical protein
VDEYIGLFAVNIDECIDFMTGAVSIRWKKTIEMHNLGREMEMMVDIFLLLNLCFNMVI